VKYNSNHSTIRSLCLREVQLKSLHHQISLVERSKTQITPPSDLFGWEKQNTNHSTITMLEWFEFFFSQPNRSDGGVIWVLLLSTKEIWWWSDLCFTSLNQRDLMVEWFEFYFSQPKRSDGGVIWVLLLSTKEIWWWSDLSFTSLNQRDLMMEWFEFCFSQPKRPDGGVIWVLLLSTWLREVILKSRHHQISLVERSKTQMTPPSDLFGWEK
jgi:hypothetical protein